MLCVPIAGLPLLQYSKSSEFLQKALRGRETFLHALESESEQSDDMVMELIQQAVQNYFETHHEELEIAELTSVEFWADDERASAMLDQILQATNAAVRQAFEHVRVGTWLLLSCMLSFLWASCVLGTEGGVRGEPIIVLFSLCCFFSASGAVEGPRSTSGKNEQLTG